MDVKNTILYIYPRGGLNQFAWGYLMGLFPLVNPWLRSRGSTGRTSSNPMGHNTGATRCHNIMVGRVVVLLCVAMAKKIWWKLEQPKGSLLEGHVLFQSMLRLATVQVSKISTSLVWFGGDTRKPLWIWSSISVKKKEPLCKTFLYIPTNALPQIGGGTCLYSTLVFLKKNPWCTLILWYHPYLRQTWSCIHQWLGRPEPQASKYCTNGGEIYWRLRPTTN